jgi:hypothetical protein
MLPMPSLKPGVMTGYKINGSPMMIGFVSFELFRKGLYPALYEYGAFYKAYISQ